MTVGLNGLRSSLRSVEDAIERCELAGIAVPGEMLGLRDRLSQMVVEVIVPCLICRRPLRVQVGVAEEGTPRGMLCSHCDRKAGDHPALQGGVSVVVGDDGTGAALATTERRGGQ